MRYNILWVFMLFPLDEQALKVIINYDYVGLLFYSYFFGSVELKWWCFSWPLTFIIQESSR